MSKNFMNGRKKTKYIEEKLIFFIK